MFQPEVAFYLGEQKNEGYSGIISQDNLFFCLEISSGISVEQGHQILDFIKEKIRKTKITNLSSLDRLITDFIKEKNLPSGLSIASGFLKDGILYLKTVGEGKIFIRRKGKLGILIEGNNTASGPVENDDLFIFMTENFFNLVDSSFGLNKIFDHKSPSKMIEEITPTLKAKNDAGAVALFVDFHKETEEDALFYRETAVEKNALRETLKTYWLMMKNSKKTLTFATVVVLFFLLVWSVVLGYQRRTSAVAKNKIKLTEELINQKLSTAEEVAFLNMDRALILIKESREEVSKLKNEIGDKRKELGELEEMIKKTENKIVKKEQRQYSEFFDLTVDSEEAAGKRFYLDQNITYILDNKRGAVYKFNLDKKSLPKEIFTEIKSASLVAGYEDKIFFYVKGSGVYLIDGGKPKKVIENDKNWGEIIDMYIYNGNIYLLDKGKDEVWKFLRGEDGYGGGASYFQSGQSIDLSSINSLSIDGSIYLAGGSIIVKYTSGLRDGFKVDLPDSRANFNKVFTSKDLEKVYLWDKKKGTVYVVGKTGEYIEQINSEILSKGSDIVVYKEEIYVLEGRKIFKI